MTLPPFFALSKRKTLPAGRVFLLGRALLELPNLVLERKRLSAETLELDNLSFIDDNGIMNEIRHYIGSNGCDHFAEWRVKVRDIKARIAIDRRIMRMELGNFGDHKPIRDGVWELRIDVGPGYRVYFAKAGATIILLLCGGDKRKQNADIDRACEYWRDWQRRNEEEGGV